MRKPRALQSGDRVAVVAPSSPFDRALFDAGVAELTQLGFNPSFDDSVFAETRYLAGPAAVRAAALMAAWEDPDVAGVFAVRGGYGSAQLLPLLDLDRIRATTKVFIGCSDLTSVLACLTNRCDMVGFHGPMLVNLAPSDEGYDRRSLLGAVSIPEPLGELMPSGVEVVRHGEARGPILGGTLTQLLGSLGTPFAFSPPDGYVLLLDDVGERPYRVDRMLTQLVQTGLLRKASAVICAEFPNCCDDKGHEARSVISTMLRDFHGPVIFGFPTGHTAGPVWTLPLGVAATVSTRPVPRVVIEEAAVS